MLTKRYRTEVSQKLLDAFRQKHQVQKPLMAPKPKIPTEEWCLPEDKNGQEELSAVFVWHQKVMTQLCEDLSMFDLY